MNESGKITDEHPEAAPQQAALIKKDSPSPAVKSVSRGKELRMIVYASVIGLGLGYLFRDNVDLAPDPPKPPELPPATKIVSMRERLAPNIADLLWKVEMDGKATDSQAMPVVYYLREASKRLIIYKRQEMRRQKLREEIRVLQEEEQRQKMEALERILMQEEELRAEEARAGKGTLQPGETFQIEGAEIIVGMSKPAGYDESLFSAINARPQHIYRYGVEGLGGSESSSPFSPAALKWISIRMTALTAELLGHTPDGDVTFTHTEDPHVTGEAAAIFKGGEYGFPSFSSLQEEGVQHEKGDVNIRLYTDLSANEVGAKFAGGDYGQPVYLEGIRTAPGFHPSELKRKEITAEPVQ